MESFSPGLDRRGKRGGPTLGNTNEPPPTLKELDRNSGQPESQLLVDHGGRPPISRPSARAIRRRARWRADLLDSRRLPDRLHPDAGHAEQSLVRPLARDEFIRPLPQGRRHVQGLGGGQSMPAGQIESRCPQFRAPRFFSSHPGEDRVVEIHLRLLFEMRRLGEQVQLHHN